MRLADATMDPTLKAFMPEIRHRINLLLVEQAAVRGGHRRGPRGLSLAITESCERGVWLRRCATRSGVGAQRPGAGQRNTSFIIQ